MSPVPIKFPLDSTGASPGNLVREEHHVLRATPVRIFATRYGPFFTESLVVKDIVANRILTRGRDYYATQMLQLPTEKYGKEICTIVVVTDPTCAPNIHVNYQALGGEYSYSSEAIAKLIETLQLDNRPVKWGNIFDKPADGFIPAPHLHDAGDVYGLEYVVTALERVTQALQVGSLGGESRMYSYIDARIKEITEAILELSEDEATREGILAALGYTPADRAGDTFTGTVGFDKGIVLNGSLREKIVKVNANTSETLLDLSLGSIFEVSVAASTILRFKTDTLTELKPNQAISFTIVFVNAVANRGVSFDSIVKWADGQVPPRTLEVNARDEFYFSTFNGGASYTGSLSDKDVK